MCYCSVDRENKDCGGGVGWGGACGTFSIETEHKDDGDTDGVGHVLDETSAQPIVYSSKLGDSYI